MKTLWNYSNYGNDLRLTRKDAEMFNGNGEQSQQVEMLLSKKYIQKQVNELNDENLVKELSEYGAWDSDELQDHNENIKRWLWISAHDILERN